MLTRLQVDGFKNLLGLDVYFGPYTCIAGTNAVGKSNIFDAINFLSLLADNTFVEAASQVRSAGGPSDPASLFWQNGEGVPGRMRLAADMIVPDFVEDDFGRSAHPTSTFLSYEIVLRYVPATPGVVRSGGIELVSESLNYIKQGEAKTHLPWPHNRRSFEAQLVRNRRQGTAYISTGEDGTVNVHQDGGSRGRPRTSPADRAPRSVVSTTTTSDDPTILACRREMQRWRILALEPSALRTSDALSGPSEVASNGANLAAALWRMSERNPEVLSQVAAAASGLVDVQMIRVDHDPRRELLTLQAQIGRDPMLPARSLSDGTLRFIALCIISLDPEFSGLICMEEPENGIHPARIPAMVNLMRDLAVDPEVSLSPDNPLRQVIVNTHSPGFVQAHDDLGDLLLALPVTRRRGQQVVETMGLLGMANSWRKGRLTRADIADYLKTPPGQQLGMDLQDRPTAFSA